MQASVEPVGEFYVQTTIDTLSEARATQFGLTDKHCLGTWAFPKLYLQEADVLYSYCLYIFRT